MDSPVLSLQDFSSQQCSDDLSFRVAHGAFAPDRMGKERIHFLDPCLDAHEGNVIDAYSKTYFRLR